MIRLNESSDQKHISVFPKEVMEYLNPQEGGTIVDATLGLGGHSNLILAKLGASGHLIGIDRDAESIVLAKEILKQHPGKVDCVQGDFRNIDTILQKLGVSEVDGILMDLGISSYQLESPQRGFSFRHEGPLDMRMDQESFISAYDLVNSLSEKELSQILKNYGQERWHNRIARFLVQQRSQKPIETTQELESIILRAIPFKSKKDKSHPATRTFQALRIAVNRELEALERSLDKCVAVLKKGGRICVISFHSLEDRIVKNKFKEFAAQNQVKILTKKPLDPSDEEVKSNSRARSAHLRAAERI